MIDGILRGKVLLTEDALTSCVVGLLSKMPPDHGLLAWLQRARPSPGSSMTMPLSFGRDARIETIRFWPLTASHGQPDGFILVTDGQVIHAIVLEAKYGAAKSNWELTDPQDPRVDQLVRYWAALNVPDLPGVSETLLARAEKTVIYVTADGTSPVEELEESVQRSSGAIRLAWLSWREAWGIAEPMRASGETVSLWLLMLLEHLGLTQFRGFECAGEPSVEKTRWYFSRGGFTNVATVTVQADCTWRYSSAGRRGER